jgi:hypothetical protein
MKKSEQYGELGLPMQHPHYKQMRAVGAYELKKAVYAYCCGVYDEKKPKFKEDAIIPECLPIWRAFKKNDFYFYKFMVEKDYELIEDEELRLSVLMGACFRILNLPIARFMTDWLNGYLDFFWRENLEITETEVLHQLFFCSTDEDIWKLMATIGIREIGNLYHWYRGEDVDPIHEKFIGIPCFCEKDEQKAEEFLEYFLSDTTVVTDRVRNEAMKLKKMAENADRTREISEDLKNLIEELNIWTPLEIVSVKNIDSAAF